MEDIMDNRRDEFDFANRYLVGDEFILWKGQPEKGNLLSKSDAVFIPFSIFWCGFAIIWEVSVISSDAPFFFCLFGLPFVAVGFYITVGRFFHLAYSRVHTWYVITNKKIIRKIGGKIDILDGQNLPSMRIELRKNGHGNINFGEAFVLPRRGLNLNGNTQEYSFSLDNIKDPLKVQEIIKTMDK
jgi:hypothetical protein